MFILLLYKSMYLFILRATPVKINLRQLLYIITRYNTSILIKLHSSTMTASINECFWFLFLNRPSARRGLKFTLGRHLRSKRRCSCVLQFTRLRAVSCVLHRPTSRVIHHSRLIFLHLFYYSEFTILYVYKLCGSIYTTSMQRARCF